MTKKIFNGILLTSIITLIACLVFVIGVEFQMYQEAQDDALKSEAYIISTVISEIADYKEAFAKSDLRITIISPEGAVIYDNKADEDQMENHLDREEIAEAIENGEGHSVRRSGTLSKKTCYYALKLKDGSFLRVSDTRVTVWTTLLTLSQPIAAILVIVILVSIILASFISKKIVLPINKIDIENPVMSDSYEEISPLIKKINLQNRRINSQIDKLKNSKLQFEAICDNMCEGLILTDNSGNIITCNSSAMKLFDTNDEIIGKNLLVLNHGEIFREIISSLEKGQYISKHESLNKMYYEITANPVRDKENNICGGVILLVDITEKESREKLRREFTANVSHELKTPLTTIYGISDMLKSGIVNQNDITGFAEDINKESSRLITLVNDIIRLSQLDEGIIADDEVSSNILEISGIVKERLKKVAESNNVDIILKVDELTVIAPPTLLEELIYNLCDNAIKYNKSGGTVTIESKIINDKPCITVADTGIGIEQKYHERIFERFYRVDKSRSKHIGGTGLGLSIVKHIVSCINASISVESKIGEGTKITVLFN